MLSATIAYSCRPVAFVPVDGDAADLLDAVLDALEADPRALAAGGCGYDYDTRGVTSTFLVAVSPTSVLDPLDTASTMARHVFDDALKAAGRGERTAGIAIVEGDDPDLLP